MPLSSIAVATFATAHPVRAATRAAAIPAILDTVAVLAAGSGEASVSRLAQSLAVSQEAGDRPSFEAGRRHRPDDSALLYGTAAHALDFDDVSMVAICHPSAPVLAALLAVGPWDRLTGPGLCDAHTIGTEVMIRMGQAIGFHHYALGFHSTATMGVFGAIAALARLRELDTATTANAFAIAASLSSGLRLNFGSMVKPLHVGIAAANAVRAIEWAQSGVEAGRGDLFDAGGVFHAFSGGVQTEWPDAIKLGAPFAIDVPGFERKRYPGCYLLHKIIALGLEAARAGIQLADVAQLRVEMPRGSTLPLIHPRPSSGSEALFSAPYALLAALNDGAVGFSTFGDAAVGRAELRIRFDDVVVTETGERILSAEEISAAPVRLDLRLVDGSVRSYARAAAPGSPSDPMTPSDLRAKWIDCFERIRPDLTAVHVGTLHDAGLAALSHGPLNDWLESIWAVLDAARAPQDGVISK